MPQPTAAVVAPAVPMIFRKSRRLTREGSVEDPVEEPVSVLMRRASGGAPGAPSGVNGGRARERGDSWGASVVAGRAVVARPVLDVTVDAPAHVERGVLVDLIHVLHRSVAALAGDAGVDVAHVRELDVVRHLVDALPGDRLPLVPVGGELLDLGELGAGDRMAAHAGADGREAWVRGLRS